VQEAGEKFRNQTGARIAFSGIGVQEYNVVFGTGLESLQAVSLRAEVA
jgi:hypothetical protein